jgi:DNA mismatch repair protein MutS
MTDTEKPQETEKKDVQVEKPDWYGDIPMDAKPLQTSMMKQFIEIKSKVPDALLLFRMGDFYEIFMEDAKKAAHALELNLTARNKKNSIPIPMAGIPYHALNNYMERLTGMGFKVALAEQEVDPNNPKIMTRSLTRVVTPGMPWDADGTDARGSCWIAAICGTRQTGVAFLDTRTGSFRVVEVSSPIEAWEEVRRMGASEVIIDARLLSNEVIHADLQKMSYVSKEPTYFDIRHGRLALKELLNVEDLTGFGADKLRAGLGSIGALISYARDMAMIDLTHVTSIHVYTLQSQMAIDEASLRNLEILQPLRGTDKKHTLLGIIDKTRTSMGGRMLRQWLSAPLIDIKRIKRRHDAVEALLSTSLREPIRESLRSVGDLERLSAKLAQEKINPRELLALANSIFALPSIMDRLSKESAFEGVLPSRLPIPIADEVCEYLQEDPPTSISDGGIIRSGINKQLDEYTELSTNAKAKIAQMESTLREETGISSLKVKYNRVFGYFIEVTMAHKDKVPEVWMRKQTLVNAERFITPELKEFEEKVLSSTDKMRTLEHTIYVELRTRLASSLKVLKDCAHRVAIIDVLSTLAEISVQHRYVRPEINDTMILDIKAGRHPVLEQMDFDEAFVPNDLYMDQETNFLMLTGPNMGGKSTVMRQVALIVLLAQIGSFVPASKATIGLCDKIFVRVGASDDLARGRSTFMVEMGETALILNRATARSLIMLDEIGRGTSTFDGLSIAWAVSEAIHNKLSARTIFATHYHELTTLADQSAHMENCHVAVAQDQHRVIFLRELRSGSCGQSFGIQCAQLAGMPRSVIRRASKILKNLEKNDTSIAQINQLSIFDIPMEEDKLVEIPENLVILQQELLRTDPNELSPLEALKFVFELQQLAQSK